MKTRSVLLIMVGIIVIPTTMIVVFTVLNYLLSEVFNVDYASLQNSEIWVVYAIIIIAMIVGYYIDNNQK